MRSIDRSGAEIVIQTEATTVFHAFRRLNVDVTTPVGLESPMRIPPPPPTGPGSVTSPLTFERTLGLGLRDEPIVLFEGDGNDDTAEDRVAGTGTLYAEVNVRFWLSFDWEDLSPAQAANELGDLLESLGDLLSGNTPSLAQLLHLQTGITMEGSIEAGMELEGRSSRHYERVIPLGTVPLGYVPVGPLVFWPALSLNARFTGAVSGSMSLGFNLEANAKLGFDLDEEDLTPIVEGPTFTQESSSPTVTASAELHGEIELSLRFPLWGTLGPYVGLAAYLDADVDRSRDPCFQLLAGLKGTSGAWIGLLGTTIASVSGPSIDIGDPRTLAAGECAPMPDPPITDTLITPWSRSYSETAWSTGTDDDFTTLSRAHDDRLLLTSATGRMALKIDENGAPIWAKTFDQPDRVFSTLQPSLSVPTLDAGVLVATRQGVLVKLDAAGDYQWAAQLETNNTEEGYFWSGELIGDHVWLAGVHRAEGSSDRQALVVLLNADGYPAIAWTWGRPDYNEIVRHVLPLEDGVVLVGEAQTPSVSDTRGFIMEVGFDGTLRWAKDVEGCDANTEPTLATAMQTGEGDLIIGGWHYAAPTRAILFRIPRDGNVSEPSWVTETTAPSLLGLQPRSIHQMETGELRVTGRLARTGGNDAVFVAATDSIGRFAWLKWYGGPRDQGPATSVVTAQGGLVATTSSTVELPPGGFWLFEVPNPNGEISFRADSDATSESMGSDSVTGCLTLTPADVSTLAYPVGVTSVHVDVSEGEPSVSVRTP